MNLKLDWTSATALGEWEVRGYVDSEEGFVETASATFEVIAEESERYQFSGYLSTDVNNQYHYVPQNHTDTFYTSDAEQGEIVRSFVWDYYYQDPGVGYKSQWYHFEQNEQGETKLVLYTQSIPVWSNEVAQPFPDDLDSYDDLY